MFSLADLQTIVEALPAGVVSFGPDWRIANSNQAAGALLGLASEQIAGRQLVDLLTPASREIWAQCASSLGAKESAALAQTHVDLEFIKSGGGSCPIRLEVSAHESVDGRQYVALLRDQTSLHESQSALARSELINRTLVDRATIGITYSDKQGNWLRVNQAYCDMLGYSKSDLMQNSNISKITHPDDRAPDQENLAKLNAGEIRRFAREKRYIRKDGSFVWARIHVAGVFDGNEVTHYATHVIDITAERAALAEAAGLQRKLQSFVDHVPALITLKDTDGRFTLVNRKQAESMQVRPESFIGRSAQEMGIKIGSENAADSDEATVLRTGEIIDRESKATDDGVLSVTRFPLLSVEGNITGVGSISTDITEIKRHEKELSKQAETIRVLQQIAMSANEAENARDAMGRCLELICDHMGWMFGNVYASDDIDSTVRSSILSYERNSDSKGKFERSHVEREPALAKARLSKTIAIDSLTASRSAVVGASAVNIIVIPIVDKGVVHALFEFYSDALIVLDDDLVKLLRFFNDQIGLAIVRENSQLDTQKTLEQLAYHIENSDVGVIQYDANFEIQSWSKACEGIFEWTAEEIVGKTVQDIDLVYPHDMGLLDELAEGFEDPQFNSYSIINRNFTKRGRIVNVEWYCSIFRDDGGAMLSLLAVVVDRTAELQALRALEDERQLYAEGPAMVMRWSDKPGLPVDYVSKNIESFLGYSFDDFVCNRTPTWLAIHPDEEAGRIDAVKAFQASGIEQQTFGTCRLLTASGDTKWVATVGLRLQQNDADVARFMAYSVDITEFVELQIQAQKQQVHLQNVVEGTDASTWEWTIATNELVVNERWAEIIGYTLEELQPTSLQTWATNVHPDDLPVAMKIVEEHLEGRRDRYEIECRYKHRDGHWVWVHDRAKIVEWDRDGKPTVVAGTHVDVSKRKDAELKVFAMNEQLQQSNVELERFAYVASHDLQEPLRMVSSFTQLLQKRYADRLDETANEYIEYAVDGANRMQQLIQDLLSYSRLGRQDLEEQPIDMPALVDRVRQSMKISVDESNAKITGNKLPVIRGDAGQILQLLQNLISNGIKYRGEADPVIDISFTTTDEGPTFCVRDNGIGIAPENIDKVFEVFRRLHSRSEVAGTGIGLSVCQRVVERHGGRIWLESTQGKGSSFFFTIGRDRHILLASEALIEHA